jgi:hypothetical protein
MIHWQAEYIAGSYEGLVETEDRFHATVGSNGQVQGIAATQASLVVADEFHRKREIVDFRRQRDECFTYDRVELGFRRRGLVRRKVPIRTSRASRDENSTFVQWLIDASPAGRRRINRSTLGVVASS